MPTINEKELGREHTLTLYAVNKAPHGVPTKTHYQKMMYMIMKAMGNDPKTVGYHPHHYGPYSDSVVEWRNTLIQSGWLNKNKDERITIPEELRTEVDKIRMPDKMLEMKISNIVKFVTSLTRNEILLYVYADDVIKDERMTEKSDIKEDIFSKRVKIASSMVRHKKVSVEKGAELADMDLQDFKKIL